MERKWNRETEEKNKKGVNENTKKDRDERDRQFHLFTAV